MNTCSFSGNDLIVESDSSVQWIDLRQVSHISARGENVALYSAEKRIAMFGIFTRREIYEEYIKLDDPTRRSELILSIRAEMIARLKKAISDVRAANV
jgi:hypothetical protein